MLVGYVNRTPEQRTLNPRVRGSSPWRRTRTDLGPLLFQVFLFDLAWDRTDAVLGPLWLPAPRKLHEDLGGQVRDAVSLRSSSAAQDAGPSRATGIPHLGTVTAGACGLRLGNDRSPRLPRSGARGAASGWPARSPSPSSWPGRTAAFDRFAADLLAVVDSVGKPFVLVGHSMAAPVSCSRVPCPRSRCRAPARADEHSSRLRQRSLSRCLRSRLTGRTRPEYQTRDSRFAQVGPGLGPRARSPGAVRGRTRPMAWAARPNRNAAR